LKLLQFQQWQPLQSKARQFSNALTGLAWGHRWQQQTILKVIAALLPSKYIELPLLRYAVSAVFEYGGSGGFVQ
jgi:hypothetical protein